MADIAATPMMRQYTEIKANYPDFLLFYRMGDFYELFADDAVKAAGILGITLTQRRTTADKDGIPMCGVPFHAAEGYIGKLMQHGLKVALCEQTENPAEARQKRGSKALVNREVVRLFTGGTLVEDSMLPDTRNNYLVALAGSADALAIAWLDASTGELSVTSSSAEKLDAELVRLSPTEILCLESLADDLAVPLASWQHALTFPRRNLFDSSLAKNRICNACRVKTLDGFGLSESQHIAACGAVLAYVEETQVGRTATVQAPKVITRDGLLQLDATTRSSLELASTLRGERKGSLVEALDYTVTASGARKLNQWLTAPLRDLKLIGARHDSIEYLLKNIALREHLRDSLKGLSDMGRALTRLLLKRGGPRDLGALAETLRRTPDLVAKLKQNQAPSLLVILAEQLEGFDGLQTELGKALADDLPLLTRDGSFIRQGYCAQLDRYRSLTTNSMDTLRELERREAEALGISSLKIRYNKVWGYYFEVTKTHMGKVPAHYIHRQTTTNSQRFTTPELVDIERELTHADSNALAREQVLFDDLSARVNEAAPRLLQAAEALAVLDVLQSAALLADRHRYSRPTMTPGTEFEIIHGRHPVVERTVTTFMPNNASLSGGQLWLLTGPNMAGKSTFLRQNALMAIMAHAGFYVPAESATIGLIDRVFTRVGAADDLARGQSTFMVEMVETANILNNASEKSLVILDEIGRGTATFDGLSIAWACVEYLAETSRCRAMFATHYHELTVLEGKLKNISNHHVAVKEWEHDIVFMHEVQAGASPRSYGIHVGRIAGLPAGVTQRAEQILDKLEDDKSRRDRLVAHEQMTLFHKPAPAAKPQPSKLASRLADIAPDELTPKQALELLYELKNLQKQEQQPHIKAV